MPRHNQFTNEEMRDMICVYAQGNFCGRSAARRYELIYPNRRQPNHKIFANLFRRLGETGSFHSKNYGGRPKNITPNQEDEILVRVDENPEVSSRRLSAATGVSQSSIIRILKKENFHPYHFTPVQNLLPRDLPRRLQFCQRILNQHNGDQNFIKNIMFTDEATFTRRGIFNWRNSHYWEEENPHALKERHFQHEFKLNIWCGIIGDKLLGPYVLPPNLNGGSYLFFLQNTLSDILDDLSLDIRSKMWFMQDGAPPHFPLVVRHHLSSTFPQRWIGRGSDFEWPPRSPDYNPLDFYVWGHLKSLVYSNEINSRDELWRKIQNAANFIRGQNNIFFDVRKSFIKRIRKGIEVGGGHIEHLI